ncbi:MAG: FCD domain-containing protein [Luteitalea sp.]|nr:FCD domain-containing protein [Luteitalea sp.]
MPLALPKDTRHRTKQEFVYLTLRDAIMTCELRPGERLVIDDLARRLKVSTIPIREALHMLQSEGLVVNVPHVGTTVAPVSRESIQDVFTVLEGLETVATKLVAERATAEDLESLAALVDRMDEAVVAGHYEQWADLNTRFHQTISAIPKLALLQEMSERVLARWGRVRRFYFQGVLVHRVAQAQQEHRAILAALRARNVAAVQDFVRQHNQAALEAYLGYLKE